MLFSNWDYGAPVLLQGKASKNTPLSSGALSLLMERDKLTPNRAFHWWRRNWNSKTGKKKHSRNTDTQRQNKADTQMVPAVGEIFSELGGGGWRGQGKFLEFSRMSPSNTQTRPRHTTCFKCPVASCELLGCRRGSSKRMVPPTPQLYHARLFAQGAKCENDKRHWVQWGWFLQKK